MFTLRAKHLAGAILAIGGLFEKLAPGADSTNARKRIDEELEKLPELAEGQEIEVKTDGYVQEMRGGLYVVLRSPPEVSIVSAQMPAPEQESKTPAAPEQEPEAPAPADTTEFDELMSVTDPVPASDDLAQ